MLETIEATIDAAGNVVLKEKVKIRGRHHALVTILDEEVEEGPTFKLAGSLEIIGDIEQGSTELSEMFRHSTEPSPKELDR